MNHSAHTLDLAQFQAALAAAKDRIVLSIPGKRTGIGSSHQEILAFLPAIVMDDAAKSAMQDFLKSPPPKEASETEKKRMAGKNPLPAPTSTSRHE